MPFDIPLWSYQLINNLTAAEVYLAATGTPAPVPWPSPPTTNPHYVPTTWYRCGWDVPGGC